MYTQYKILFNPYANLVCNYYSHFSYENSEAERSNLPKFRVAASKF